MANKTYLVTDEFGTELKTLKTLAAAKKLADEEGGKVLCDGEVVYKAVTEQEEPLPEEITASPVEEEKGPQDEESADETEALAEEPLEEMTEKLAEEPAEEPAEKPATETPVKEPAEQYKLLALMNIRSKPSLRAPIIGLAKPGSIVDVFALEDDWLKVAGGYILFGHGQFAVKV